MASISSDAYASRTTQALRFFFQPSTSLRKRFRINIILCIHAKTPTSKDLPEQTFVRPAIPISICLDDSISRSHHIRITRLKCQGVDKEVKEHDISVGGRYVCPGIWRPPVSVDQGCVNVVPDISP